MKIGLGIFAIYTVVLVILVTRYDRPKKNLPRITGRGGDFE